MSKKSYNNPFDIFLDEDNEENVIKPVILKKTVRLPDVKKTPIIKEVPVLSKDSSYKYAPPVLNDYTTGFDDFNVVKKKDKKDKKDKIRGNETKDIDLSHCDILKTYRKTHTYKGDDLRLHSQWNVWIHDKQNTEWGIETYENILCVDNVGSMLRFCKSFRNLDKYARQYYVMRNGIMPIWEDNNNKGGAICSILMEHMAVDLTLGDIGVQSFIIICILVMNESFVRNNICINGMSYSIKSGCVLIKFWIKNYKENYDFVEKIPKTLMNMINDVILSVNNIKTSKSKISIQIKPIV
uniref:Uncharacterized protein n=1 Tax=viral metagenome TaxID=1070528 RepID=A0A6C0BDA7_9ZZZZ